METLTIRLTECLSNCGSTKTIIIIINPMCVDYVLLQMNQTTMLSGKVATSPIWSSCNWNVAGSSEDELKL
jgi:predicted metal-binding protein